MHLEKVLAFVELCVPLGPLFDRLPRAEFDEATATPEQIVQQALLEEEFLAWAAKDVQKDASPQKLQAHALHEELEEDDEGADDAEPTAAFRIGEQVEVRLLPPASKDGTPSSSDKVPKWVPAVVCEFDPTKSGLRYICHLPADYDGKSVRRSQTFNADDVKKVAGATVGVERSPAPVRRQM